MSDSTPSPVEPQETSLYRPTPEGPGARIGPYKLLQEIGEGGFGTVYMAEQEQPVRRKVALKIIKQGMDTKEVIARFESERQALALMDHPNIARVLDAGATQSGRPYFVMELVRGVPITEYCDKNNLTTAERLELFCNVCRAVQHAHQKGVIHRDIKPSNVLVTLHDGQPIPKVIDFGVAKATTQRLTERTMFTAYGQMIGTPAYMSPEQAEMSGLDIDTRSDIYSLGVLLYELLTGTTPLEMKRLKEASYVEMQRIIREDDPPKPSTRISTLGEQQTIIASHRRTDPAKLRQLLKGDLDLIVMKALEKDRGRRYETPNSFAQDIERYLHQEPILARPPSAVYRLRKFAARNKAAVVTGSAIAVCLILGTIISSILAIVALQQRNSARDSLAIAEVKKAEADAARRDAEQQRNLAMQAERSEKLLRQIADQQRSDAELARQAEAELRAAADEKRLEIERKKAQIDRLNSQLVDSLSAQRRTLYASQMIAAQKAWESDNIPYLLEMLDSHRPKPGEEDLRGFEWHFWNRRCNSDLSTLKLPISFAPESGGGLTVASNGRTIEIMPDATRLAGLFRSGPPGKQVERIRVWDLDQGAELPAIDVAPAAPRNVGDAAASNVVPATEPGVSAMWGRWLLPIDAQHVALLTPFRSAQRSADRPSPERLAGRLAPQYAELTNYDLDSQKATFTIFEPMVGSYAVARGAGQIACLVNDREDEKGNLQQVAKIFNAKTGELVATLPLAGGPWVRLAISDDGSRVAASTHGVSLSSPLMATNRFTVKIWDVATQQEAASFTPLIAHSFEFSPDGQRLIAIGASKEDNPSLDSFTTTRAANLPDAYPTFNAAAFDIASGQRLWAHPVANAVTAAMTRPEISPDGQWVTFLQLSILAHDRSLRLYNTATGAAVEPLKGHAHPLLQAGFLADGGRVRTLDKDGTIKTWAIPTTASTTSPALTYNPTVLAILSPDGACQANVPARSSAGGDLSVLDTATKATLWKEKIPAMVEQIAFSLDGKYIAASWSASKSDPPEPGQVRIWETATGQVLRSLPKTTLQRNLGYARVETIRVGPDFAFSANSADIVVSNLQPGVVPSQFRLQRIDIASGRETLISEPIAGKPVELECIPNSKRILCEVVPPPASSAKGSAKGAPSVAPPPPVLRAIDGTSGRVVWTLTPVPRLRVVTPDGVRLCGNSSRDVYVWETENAQVIQRIALDAPVLTKLSLSPDGQRLIIVRPIGLASVPQQPTLVNLWDVESGMELFKLQGHVEPVVDVVFSPDGKRIATTAGSSADTLIWDAETGQSLLTLPGADFGLSFTDDSRQLRGIVTGNPFGQFAPMFGTGRRVVLADATALAPQAEAQRLIEVFTRTSGKLLSRSEIRAAIEHDHALSVETRSRALEMLAQQRRAFAPLNNASYGIAKRKDQSPAAYQRALELAAEAAEIDPQSPNVWNTRGVANYRAGNYEQARADLEQSIQRLSAARRLMLPENIVFLAMAQHQLGNSQEALKQLNRYRDIVLRSASNRLPDWHAHLAEAEELLGVAKPPPADLPEIAGWGKPIDPRGDCKIAHTDGTVSISIPGSLRSLSPARNNYDAPRVLREVKGDFTAEVKVTCELEPKKPLTDSALTYVGAGLLVWSGSDNFLRVERNGYAQHSIYGASSALPTFSQDKQKYSSHAPLVEYWRGGREVTSGRNVWNSSTSLLPGPSTWLRVQRRGSLINIALSHDGKQWEDVPPVETNMPDRVQLGVLVMSGAGDGFEASFSDFRHTQP